MKKLSNKIFEKSRRHSRRKNRVNTILKTNTNLPRVIVNRTNKYIYSQVVDVNWNVIASSNDLNLKTWTKKERAFIVGQNLSKKLQDKNLVDVCFDRNWYIYHWRVEQVAEWLRDWKINI